VAKRELKLECDYEYEARCQGRFKELVEGDPQLAGDFRVPGVVPALSAAQVLTSEWVEGYAIDKVGRVKGRAALFIWVGELVLLPAPRRAAGSD
jgi:predicted unusual protein kinase regulating ubiquinone biosynthesis (AarF/ABC1/UbiB family)